MEGAVAHVPRQILARIDPRQFFSLGQINDAIVPLLEKLNDTPFQKRPGSRRSQFEAHDRPALRPLPPTAFELREWSVARVNLDYHVEVKKAFYSVPHIHVHARLDVAVSQSTVECFHNGIRIASHPRNPIEYSYNTNSDHMPAHHRAYKDQEKLLARARRIGPHADELAQNIMARFIHPEQGYRSVLGILRLVRGHGRERVDAACAQAISLGAYSSRNVNAILKHWQQSPPESEAAPLIHENLRTGEYYATNSE